jgi:alanine racemase
VSEHRAEAIINLNALASNIATLSSQTEADILAVVKAGAYGHGLIPVAKKALESGARWLGVALLEEALTLRAAGISAPIIAWLTPPGDDFARAITEGIDLSISSLDLLDVIERTSSEVGRSARIHIEIDTGMTRGGVLGAWEKLLHRLKTTPLEVVGVWSHFSSADEREAPANAEQMRRFEEKLNDLALLGIHPPYIHFANSAATINFPRIHKNIIRLGIAMYGLSPDVTLMGSSSALGLTPVMSLRAKLHLVKDVPAGSAVGYGGTAITTSPTKIGVVMLGYSDGIPRNTSSAVGVYSHGRVAPILGRVSMDQFVVDLGEDSQAKAGEYVELFGPHSYSVDDWAQASGTINYEIVTRIASRVPRVYLS